jgi:hypothetical protein
MVRVARGGRDGIESKDEDDMVGSVFSNGSQRVEWRIDEVYQMENVSEVFSKHKGQIYIVNKGQSFIHEPQTIVNFPVHVVLWITRHVVRMV